MSANQGGVPHHDVPHEDGATHVTRRGYLIGFALSVLLTALPFWLVMGGALGDATATAIAVIALAFVQIVVHTIFFLHVNTRAEGGWTLMALMFTVVMVVIVVSGSIWIMYHLNSNMMPMNDGTTAGGAMTGANMPGM